MVSNPVGDGRYAAINPCDPNINVYVNGERITDITTVTEKDHIGSSPVPMRKGIPG